MQKRVLTFQVAYVSQPYRDVGGHPPPTTIETGGAMEIPQPKRWQEVPRGSALALGISAARSQMKARTAPKGVSPPNHC